MRRVILRLALATALSGTVSSAFAETNPACWNKSEIDAARVRHIQSILMVAAFSCNDRDYDARGTYNQFVRTHRQKLMDHNDRLKRHFMRTAGPAQGQQAYDRFTTALANHDADDAQAMPGDYCESASMIGREAIETEADGLVTLAADVRAEPIGTDERCEAAAPVQTAATAETPADEAPAPVLAAEDAAPADAVQPSFAELAQGAADPALSVQPAVATVAAPEPPVPALAAAAAPAAVLTPAAATVADPDIAGPDPAQQAETAKALAAAAKALAAAADALKAATGSLPDAGPVARASVPAARLH